MCLCQARAWRCLTQAPQLLLAVGAAEMWMCCATSWTDEHCGHCWVCWPWEQHPAHRCQEQHPFHPFVGEHHDLDDFGKSPSTEVGEQQEAAAAWG